MREISLLDCTLRDGGYVNDWKFGKNTIISIFERLVASGVEFIEIGFLDQRRPFDPNRSIIPDVKSVNKIYGNLDKGNAQLVGMIDYGTLDIDKIIPCSESCLDGIRVIFKKHLREEALNYIAQIKALGYKVFAQLVSITSYSDEELMDLIRLANEVKPYAVSMVDTYGLCHSDTLMHYADLLDEKLDKEISLGYHAHNNFQLGYANCIELLSKKTERNVLVDGTVFGMGKSAGNCPVELLGMYLNDRHGKNYDINQFLEAADSNVMSIYNEAPWGYSMFYFIAASNDCHPSYVSYLMKKRTLSIRSINHILKKLQGDKKLLYDEKLIEDLYIEHQEKEIDDKEDLRRLSEELNGKKILILGPGNSVVNEKEKVHNFVVKNNPVVISINFIPSEIKPEFCFITNAKRFVQLSQSLAKNADTFKVIATSNVTSSTFNFDYKLKYSSLLDFNAQIIDNSFLMLLKVLNKLGVSSVAAAGFDGYRTDNMPNYFNPDMEYVFTSNEASELNDYVIGELNKLSSGIKVDFITKSYYDVIRNYKAVLFDLDGTILDTSEGVLESVRDTITKLNLKELTNAEIKTFIGPPVEWSFKDKCGMDGEDLVETCKVFRDIYANRNLLRATPYEGIFELMAKLKEKGIKLAVATYKKEAYTGRLLDEYGFDKYLDIFHGSDPEGKLLKSDIIELCLKEMGVTSYADVLMVGDSKHDAGGAASLGIDFAGVSYGFGFGEGDFAADDINDYPHVAYVDKPLELLNLF